MEAEQTDILTFLRQLEPWKALPEEVQEEVSVSIEIRYFKADSQILEFGEPVQDLHLIRSGAVEIYRRSGVLYNRLSEGDIFGQQGLLRNRQVRFPAKAVEDTLIYFIPGALFDTLFQNYEVFADYVEVEDSARLQQAVSRGQDSNRLMTSRVRKLISREPVSLPASATVTEAARQMTAEGVSSLLVTAPAGHQEKLAGILTDRDLRTRVMAEGLSGETPLQQIMSPDLITIESGQFVFEAMLSMLRHNIHHLPVMEGGRPRGVIALSDLVQYESQNSLFLVSQIFRAQSLEELQQLRPEVAASFVRLVNEDANSHMIGSAMAVIGRSFKQRLLELAEEQLGPPPVPYCFLALGSMARDEQLIVTDQDNALILSDDFVAEQHDDYFLQLARFVSDGLATLGYSYCTGDIMATNSRWRQPLQAWRKIFTQWMSQPTPETLLSSNIFFDLDGVAGEVSWAEDLRQLVASRAPHSKRFLACMARNALNRTPPLGFFRNFVLEPGGGHKNSINLKRRGTAPLSDLIRVHALAAGSTAQNSFERLEDVIRSGKLAPGTGPEIRDAFEFISMVRIRHQAAKLEEGKTPDNNVRPEDLTHFERRSLKDAFRVLSNGQNYLKFRYHPTRSD